MCVYAEVSQIKSVLKSKWENWSHPMSVEVVEVNLRAVHLISEPIFCVTSL